MIVSDCLGKTEDETECKTESKDSNCEFRLGLQTSSEDLSNQHLEILKDDH